MLCDTGSPRNARARALHGFLTRDGTPPLDLLRLGRAELDRYSIEQRSIAVTDIHIADDAFELTLADNSVARSRTVLIACGVRDCMPRIPGLDACLGITAHHCPYCDGWEAREKTIVVIGQGRKGAGLALSLKTWSDRVLLYSNGSARLQPADRDHLARRGVPISEMRIASIEHTGGKVDHLVLAGGERIACDAIFLTTTQQPQSDLPNRLGCSLTRHGLVKTDHLGRTGVPGLYVAGDASRDVQFAVVAAAEGAKAGVAINQALQQG